MLCKYISAEARRRIVEYLMSSRGRKREVARVLGVSPPAVIKYERGGAAPRAEVLCRVLFEPGRVSYDEAEGIKQIILEDIVEYITEFLKWAVERNLLTESDIKAISSPLTRASLALLGGAPRAP